MPKTNTPKALLGSFLLVANLASFSLVSAATAGSNYAPENAYQLIEFNSTKENPFKGKLQGYLDEMATTDSEHPQILEMFKRSIEATDITYSQAAHADGTDINVLSMPIAQSDFEAALAAYPASYETKDIGAGRIIYSEGPDLFFTYKDGNLIMASREGIISDILMTSDVLPNIRKNSSFQAFQEKVNSDSFFKYFIDFSKKPQPEYEYISPTESSLKAQGVAVSQNSTGIKAQVYLENKADSNYQVNNFSATPELYRKLNADKLLLYTESYNWTGRLTSLSNVDTGSSEYTLADPFAAMREEFFKSTGLELSDLSSVFSRHTSLVIHDDTAHQDLVSISMLSSSDSSSSQNLINKIKVLTETKMIDAAKADYQRKVEDREFLKEYYPDEYANAPALPTLEEYLKLVPKMTLKTINGINYQQLTFQPDQNGDLPFINMNTGTTPVTLSFATLADGTFFFTTASDPSTVLSTQGLEKDPEFNRIPHTSTLYDIGYINLKNVHTFASYLAEKSGETEVSEAINKFLAPLQSLSTSTMVLPNNALFTEFQINMDMSQIGNYIDALKDLGVTFPLGGLDRGMTDYTENWQDYLYEDAGFEDVKSDDWFYRQVNHVANTYIMEGNDSIFRPNEAINRAEFIKTVMSALEYNGNYYTEVEPEKYFSDVSADAWYAYPINKARAHGIISGYSDNTFHPYQSISRAEAVQILNNALADNDSYQVNHNLDLPFTDVSSNAWYYQAVKAAFQNKLVSGKTFNHFGPNDTLTRAETATIVSRYLNTFKSY